MSASNYYSTSVPIFQDETTCENYYLLDGFRYHMNFPIAWAVNHKSWDLNSNEKSGPRHCANCLKFGLVNGAFLWYCLNCMRFTYKGNRIPSMEGIGIDDYPPAFHHWHNHVSKREPVCVQYHQEEIDEEQDSIASELDEPIDEHLDEYDVIYYARKQSRRKQKQATRQSENEDQTQQEEDLWTEIAKELAETKAYQQLEDDLCL
jgi:hypothetical protein